MMTAYLCAEIDGQAAACAQLIGELREEQPELLVNQRGFLLIPEPRWAEFERLAARHDCLLRLIERSREAA